MKDYKCTYLKSACKHIKEGKEELKEIGFQEHCLWCVYYKKDGDKKMDNKSIHRTKTVGDFQ